MVLDVPGLQHAAGVVVVVSGLAEHVFSANHQVDVSKAPWGSFTLLSYYSLCTHLLCLLFTCGAIQSSEKYSRIRLRNTKLAQACGGRFREETAGKRTGPIAKWPPRRLLFTWFKIVFVTISPFTKRTKVVPKVFQEGECYLEGLMNLACGLQLQCY